jgi:hypothetical protein
MKKIVKFNPGYSSPLECWSCKKQSACLGACLFVSNDGLIYFHCGNCTKNCCVIGCNECLPNQSHHCKWCNGNNVSHQEKDCILLKRIALTLNQTEIHLQAQNQAEQQKHALVLEEKKIIFEKKKLKDEMLSILECLKTHDLEILILSNSSKENLKQMRKEVKKQIDEFINPSLMSIINHKVENFPLLITY